MTNNYKINCRTTYIGITYRHNIYIYIYIYLYIYVILNYTGIHRGYHITFKKTKSTFYTNGKPH